jgi:HlyD family secretion protein
MSGGYSTRPSAGRYLLTGFLTLLVLVFGFIGWSAAARISGAVIAVGSVEVEGNRQIVQHPTGGVIEAIHARDGDRVAAGAVLVRLEGDRLRSELAVVEGQYFEIVARKNRLAAERDGLDQIEFAPEVVDGAERDPDLALLVTAQTVQFEAHRRARDMEAAALNERIVQVRRQIDGLQAQGAATRRQKNLMQLEVEAQETLRAKGLVTQSQLFTPQRELARLEGAEATSVAAAAEGLARIAEIEIEILRLTSEARRDAIAELRDLEFREIGLRERRASLQDEVARLDLRAPVAGVVYGSTADTLRGVIRPAEPVMFIVPEAVPLLVQARVEPEHIDQVRVGQSALLRFSAFNTRMTPETRGTVAKISADKITNERTGQGYYRAEVVIDEAATVETVGGSLLPGMPVEVFIQTDSRSPLSYLVKPLSDYFTRAFRES